MTKQLNWTELNSKNSPQDTIHQIFKRYSSHQNSVFFLWPCETACRILFPSPRIEPRPWQQKCGVLATGPPGNSQNACIKTHQDVSCTWEISKNTYSGHFIQLLFLATGDKDNLLFEGKSKNLQNSVWYLLFICTQNSKNRLIDYFTCKPNIKSWKLSLEMVRYS